MGASALPNTQTLDKTILQSALARTETVNIRLNPNEYFETARPSSEFYIL